MKKERILALVDAENLYYTPRKIWGVKARVDYSKLYRLITQGQDDAHAIVYLTGDPIINQAPFLRILCRIGYTPRLKIIFSKRGVYSNGNWDEEIIRDGFDFAHETDHLVLVSGDGGFSDLVDFYKRNGKRVTIHCFEPDFSSRLKIADNICFLNRGILMPPKKTMPPLKRQSNPLNVQHENTVINYL